MFSRKTVAIYNTADMCAIVRLVCSAATNISVTDFIRSWPKAFSVKLEIFPRVDNKTQFIKSVNMLCCTF